MAFDYKKEFREFYMPKNKPGIVTVPSMNFIAVLVSDRATPTRRAANIR